MNNQVQKHLSTDPFFLPGGAHGVLLVHGFLTAPDEMRLLGDYLAADGMTVSGIRLRGHGTRPEDLADIHWQDWVEDVRKGLAALRQHCTRVSIAGLSLGGVLALTVAANEEVEHVIAFSVPDATLLRRRLLPLVGFLRWLPPIPKVGSDVRDPAARQAHYTYDEIPLHAAAELYPLTQEMTTLLPRVTAPTLLVHAQKDRLVTEKTITRIATQLSGPHHIARVPRGGHTVVIDYGRALAFQITAQWLKGTQENEV